MHFYPDFTKIYVYINSSVMDRILLRSYNVVTQYQPKVFDRVIRFVR